MEDLNPLTEMLRPHVAAIMSDARDGLTVAQEIISTYRMYCACPGDPGAPALCQCYFEEWKRCRMMGERDE